MGNKALGKGTIPLEERYETSEKMPEPKFDILQQNQYLEAGRKKREEEAALLKDAKAKFKREFGFKGERRYHFNIKDSHRAQMINFNALQGRKKAELERWRDEHPHISPEAYAKEKNGITDDLKANALWAEKLVSQRTQIQKDKFAKERLKAAKASKKTINRPKAGAVNSAMKSIKKG